MLDVGGVDSDALSMLCSVYFQFISFWCYVELFNARQDGSSMLAVYVQFMFSFSTLNDKRIRHLFSDFSF